MSDMIHILLLDKYVTQMHGSIPPSCLRTIRRSMALSEMSTASSPGTSSDGLGERTPTWHVDPDERADLEWGWLTLCFSYLNAHRRLGAESEKHPRVGRSPTFWSRLSTARVAHLRRVFILLQSYLLCGHER